MKRPKSDPAKGTKLIKAYEKDLKLLLTLYKQQVIRAFKQSSGQRLLESKKYNRYEPPVTIQEGRKGLPGEPIPTHNIVSQKVSPQAPEPIETVLPREEPKLNEDQFFNSLQDIDKQVSQTAKETITKHTKKAYSQGETYADQHIKAAGVDVSSGISFNLPAAKETIAHLERRQDVLFSGLSTEVSKSIHVEVSNGVMAGESVYQIADRFDKVFEGQYYKAERIARTETMTSLNQGALDRYRSAGFNKVKWLAAEDERTCKRPLEFMGKIYAGCGGLDGKEFDINNCPPIPYHPNCRCTIIPVSSREDSTSMEGYRLLHEGPAPPRFAANGDVWIVTEG